jgi:hypothetical protein
MVLHSLEITDSKPSRVLIFHPFQHVDPFVTESDVRDFVYVCEGESVCACPRVYTLSLIVTSDGRIFDDVASGMFLGTVINYLWEHPWQSMFSSRLTEERS